MAVISAERARTEARALQLLRDGYSIGQVADKTSLDIVEVREIIAAAELTRAAQPARPPVRPQQMMRQPAATVPTPPQIARPTGQQETIRIRADQLFVDDAYQRDLNLRWVLGKVREYDPKLLGVLEVSARPDGRYAVVDGRHRLELIRNVDPEADTASVLCHVHRGLTVEQEAELFGRIDSGRRKLSSWDRWKARRAAGDEKVLAIEQTVKAAGLRIVTSATPRGKGDKGVVASTMACETLVDLGGLQLLADSLAAAVTAWGLKERIDAEVLTGIGYVRHIYTPDELPADRLTEALSNITHRQLKVRAAALRETTTGALARLVGQTIVGLVNDYRGGRPAVQPFSVRVPHRQQGCRRRRTEAEPMKQHREAQA